jgi:acyl-CoA synthetase (NDP forming)
MPIFTYAEECVEALAMLRQYGRHLALDNGQTAPLAVDRQRAAALLSGHAAAGRSYLGDEAMELLGAYGIPVAPSLVATDVEEALAGAESIGYPLVMKVRSPDIVHKSDVGGVVVGVGSPEAVRQAFHSILSNARERRPDARVEGVVLQRMIAAGREMILGGKRDEQFGPVVMLGLGGVYVEILGDVALRLAPINHVQAEQMLGELRGAKLLGGVRGEAPADIPSLLDALVRLAQLMVDCPQIVELDVNPLKVLEEGQGSVAVDARIILG